MNTTFQFENQKELEDIYFHDCVYQGFAYDYTQRTIRLELTHAWLKKRYRLCFQNVAALQLQSCGFWGEGNAVFHLWIDEDPAYFRTLEEQQTKNAENYRFSLLDQGIQFISIIMQLNSGDELKITCQQIEVTEDDL